MLSSWLPHTINLNLQSSSLVTKQNTSILGGWGCWWQILNKEVLKLLCYVHRGFQFPHVSGLCCKSCECFLQWGQSPHKPVSDSTQFSFNGSESRRHLRDICFDSWNQIVANWRKPWKPDINGMKWWPLSSCCSWLQQHQGDLLHLSAGLPGPHPAEVFSEVFTWPFKCSVLNT